MENKVTDKPKKISSVKLSPDTIVALQALCDVRSLPMPEVTEQVIGAGLLAIGNKSARVDGSGAIFTQQTLETLVEWANLHGMQPTEAIDRLVTVAIGRLGALSTYADKMKIKRKAMEERKAVKAAERAAAKATVPPKAVTVAPVEARVEPAPPRVSVAASRNRRPVAALADTAMDAASPTARLLAGGGLKAMKDAERKAAREAAADLKAGDAHA